MLRSQLFDACPQLFVVTGNQQIHEVGAETAGKLQRLSHEWCAPYGWQPQDDETSSTGLKEGLRGGRQEQQRQSAMDRPYIPSVPVYRITW